MPLYDYRCETCNTTSEIRHGFDEQAAPCPSCGGPLKRLFHAASIVFKGSGFYINDSKPAPAKTAASGESGSGAAPAPAAETKAATTSDSSSAPTPPTTAPPAPKGEAAA